jgi:uncharacterized protein (UPF0335 family)
MSATVKADNILSKVRKSLAPASGEAPDVNAARTEILTLVERIADLEANTAVLTADHKKVLTEALALKNAKDAAEAGKARLETEKASLETQLAKLTTDATMDIKDAAAVRALVAPVVGADFVASRQQLSEQVRRGLVFKTIDLCSIRPTTVREELNYWAAIGGRDDPRLDLKALDVIPVFRGGRAIQWRTFELPFIMYM